MNIFNRNKTHHPQIVDFPISNVYRPEIKKSITEEDLEEGELICSKCKGVGFLNKIKSENTSMYKDICPKCQGTGKLDWIENIRGKKPMTFHGTSSSGSSLSSSVSSGMQQFTTIDWSNVRHGGVYGPSIKDEIICQMTTELTKKIDDEILEMIKKGG